MVVSGFVRLSVVLRKGRFAPILTPRCMVKAALQECESSAFRKSGMQKAKADRPFIRRAGCFPASASGGITGSYEVSIVTFGSLPKHYLAVMLADSSIESIRITCDSNVNLNKLTVAKTLSSLSCSRRYLMTLFFRFDACA